MHNPLNLTIAEMIFSLRSASGPDKPDPGKIEYTGCTETITAAS